MKFKADPYSAFLHLILVALGGLVLVLGQENHRLKEAMAAPAATPAATATGLEVGQEIETVHLRHLDGDEKTLDFAAGGKDRLLLVFTTTCPACRVNQTAWRALHEEVGDAVEIVGVSLSEEEETRGYREAHELLFPVTVPLDRDRFTETLAVSAIPMTIRVGADGRVRGSWLGTLSEAQLAEVAFAGQG